MKKNLLLIVCLLIAIDGLRANVIDSLKTQSDTSYVQKNFISLNLILPGMSYETKVGKNSTLYGTVALTYTMSVSEYSSASGSIKEKYFNVNPYVALNFRNYYNFDKRISKGKNVKHNSANYFGVSTSYVLNPLGKTSTISNHLEIGPVWGFQRTYASGFYLNLNLGLGYFNSNIDETLPILNYDGSYAGFQRLTLNQNGLTPIGMFNLGFYIGKK